MDLTKVLAGVKMIIDGIGDDVNREGLVETPKRVATIWKSFFDNNEISDKELLEQSFSVEKYNDFVIVKDVQFSSFCEHHLLPFFGKVAIAYIPRDNTVIGLSKLARVVDKHAKRLQIQERLTQQILNSIVENVSNDGVLVVVSAQHMCMTARGVMKPGSETITRALSGKFISNKSLVIEAQQIIFGKCEQKLS